MASGVAAVDTTLTEDAGPSPDYPPEKARLPDEPPSETQALAQAVSQARGREDLPMDETEYRDQVDNEFIRGRMENVVRVATGDDISVTFGDGCSTDMAGTIQVDPYDLGKDAPPENRIIMMQGGLEHEICHELYYDKAAYTELQQQVDSDPSRSQVAYLSNVLVDGHDEWRHKLDRPEAYEMIEAHDALWVQSNGSGRWSFDPDRQNTWQQVTGAMLYRGLPYYQVPEEKLSPEALAAYRECSPHVDAAVAGTSWDCLREANEIHDILKRRGLIPDKPETDHLGGGAGPGNAAPPGFGGEQGQTQPSGDPSGNPSGDSSGESGDDSSAAGSGPGSGAQDRPLTEEERKQMSEKNASASGSGDASGSGGDSQSPESGGGEDYPDGAADEFSDRAPAEDQSRGGGGEGGETAGGESAGPASGDTAGESGSASGSEPNPFTADGQVGQDALDNRRGQARSLANTANRQRPQSGYRDDPAEKVRRSPDSLPEFRERWTTNRRTAQQFAEVIEEARTETLAPKSRQESGRLDRSRRRALAVGDSKVFVKRGKARKTDMSVEFLLDVSGSMKTKVSGLKDSAAIISQGLDLSDIPHEVRGFGSPDEQPLYRSFKEKADWKLGAIRATGSTALAEGMEKVRGGFAGRKEKQKLALVLTDGIADNEPAAREQIAAARREGATVVGIFLRENVHDPKGPYADLNKGQREMYESRFRIMEERSRELFGGKVAVIDDVRQLPKVAGKKIVDLLRRER